MNPLEENQNCCRRMEQSTWCRKANSGLEGGRRAPAALPWLVLNMPRLSTPVGMVGHEGTLVTTSLSNSHHFVPSRDGKYNTFHITVNIWVTLNTHSVCNGTWQFSVHTTPLHTEGSALPSSGHVTPITILGSSWKSLVKQTTWDAQSFEQGWERTVQPAINIQ